MITHGLRRIHLFDRCANIRSWMNGKCCTCDLFKDTGLCSWKAEERTFDRLGDRWRDNIKMGLHVIGCQCVCVCVYRTYLVLMYCSKVCKIGKLISLLQHTAKVFNNWAIISFSRHSKFHEVSCNKRKKCN